MLNALITIVRGVGSPWKRANPSGAPPPMLTREQFKSMPRPDGRYEPCTVLIFLSGTLMGLEMGMPRGLNCDTAANGSGVGSLWSMRSIPSPTHRRCSCCW